MASAAATMFLLKRGNCDFTVALTGLASGAELSCTDAAAEPTSTAITNKAAYFMTIFLLCERRKAYTSGCAENKSFRAKRGRTRRQSTRHSARRPRVVSREWLQGARWPAPKCRRHRTAR